MWLFGCRYVLFLITQDYTEEFRDITKGSKSKEALPAGSITLINQRPVGEDLHVKFCFKFTQQQIKTALNFFVSSIRLKISSQVLFFFFYLQ